MEMNSGGKTSCKNVSNLTSKRYQLYTHKKQLYVHPYDGTKSYFGDFQCYVDNNDCLWHDGGVECCLVLQLMPNSPSLLKCRQIFRDSNHFQTCVFALVCFDAIRGFSKCARNS